MTPASSLGAGVGPSDVENAQGGYSKGGSQAKTARTLEAHAQQVELEARQHSKRWLKTGNLEFAHAAFDVLPKGAE
jgi:hypothetical protein